ncbi:MAG: hypothetical protein E6Q50_11165 [Lysobacter sp.]|nr:MAG: hypothetical protein E6Q50_11165 [Lysobacter sp.]
MSRLSTTLNVVLIAVVLAQGWMLYDRPSPAETATNDRVSDGSVSHEPASSDPARSVDSAGNEAPLAMAVMDRLQRIDARLAVLERAARSSSDSAVEMSRTPPSAASAPSDAAIDPRTLAEADRRLASLLPVRELDRAGWARWQTSLASMPPDDRFALSAAFARAVNQNKIRLKF